METAWTRDVHGEIKIVTSKKKKKQRFVKTYYFLYPFSKSRPFCKEM